MKFVNIFVTVNVIDIIRINNPQLSGRFWLKPVHPDRNVLEQAMKRIPWKICFLSHGNELTEETFESTDRKNSSIVRFSHFYCSWRIL